MDSGVHTDYLTYGPDLMIPSDHDGGKMEVANVEPGHRYHARYTLQSSRKAKG